MKKTLSLLLGVAALAGAAVAVQPAAAAVSEPLTDQIAGLAAKPIDSYRYDKTRRCSGGPQRGATALNTWLARNVKGVSWGIYNCRTTRLGKNLSLHAEGRAVDWHLDVRKRSDRKAAYRLIDALLAPDASGRPRALARRMGVQEIIYDCKIWTAYDGDRGMRRYSGCRPGASATIAHRDHLHIGLNWRGARAQSSFWQLAPAR
jgi:hypothetical protein